VKALVELLKTLTRRRKEFRPKREGWTDPPLKEMLTFKKRKRTKQEQHDFVVNWINRIRLENDAGARKN
jgi:hypothetical protein